MIKNIFLDLDDTILDFHKAEKNALTKTLTKIGVAPKESILARYSELNLSQWKLLERGLLTREQVKIRRFKLLFDEIGIGFPAQKATEIYESFLGQGHYFTEGAPELLQSLFGRYRLYLASNGTANVQKGRMKSAGIEKYFDDIFVSQYIGFNKPDA